MLAQKVLLIGPMGAGKSTIGKLLSKDLGWDYYDNDTELSAINNLSAKQLGTLELPELHALESACLQSILNRNAPFISGAAGSVVDSETNQKLIKEVFAVYLRLPLAEIISRAGSTGIGRQISLAAGPAEIQSRFERRDPIYKECAQLTIDLSDSPTHDAALILNALKV